MIPKPQLKALSETVDHKMTYLTSSFLNENYGIECGPGCWYRDIWQELGSPRVHFNITSGNFLALEAQAIKPASLRAPTDGSIAAEVVNY